MARTLHMSQDCFKMQPKKTPYYPVYTLDTSRHRILRVVGRAHRYTPILLDRGFTIVGNFAIHVADATKHGGQDYCPLRSHGVSCDGGGGG